MTKKISSQALHLIYEDISSLLREAMTMEIILTSSQLSLTRKT